MSRITSWITAAGLLALTLPLGARADSYLIDPSHTSIIFGISHMGYSYTYGRFSIDKSSNFMWDSANPAASRFQLAIPVSSLDTNDQQRDDHLRGADFFNAKQFPHIVFQSTSVRPMPQNPSGFTHEVVGNLTLHGQTKQVTIPLKKMGEGSGPMGNYRSGFFCQTTIKRSDFGMTNMLPAVGDQVAITISFEGIRQAAGSGSGNSAGAGSAKSPGSGSAAKGSGSAPKAGSSGTR